MCVCVCGKEFKKQGSLRAHQLQCAEITQTNIIDACYERWAVSNGKSVRCKWCNKIYLHDTLVNVRLEDHTKSDMHKRKEYINRPNRRLYTAERNSHGSPDNFEIIMAQFTVENDENPLDTY